MARLLDRYKEEIAPGLMEALKLDNPMAVPRLRKVVVSMGTGSPTQDKNRLPAAMEDLTKITGQKPQIRRATKSVSNFKIRDDNEVGCRVTLRGQRMYEFFDRLVNSALPRIRDFRGLPTKAFDGRGNYSLGLREQLVFPEIEYDKIDRIRGMQININTTARSDEEGKRLLELLGMPFVKGQGN